MPQLVQCHDLKSLLLTCHKTLDAYRHLST